MAAMSEFLLRPMRIDDLVGACELVRQFDPALVELAQAAFQDDLGLPVEWPERRYRLIAEHAGQIVGTMGYGPGAMPSDGIMWTNWLMISDQRRRTGVGSAIYTELESILQKVGCRKVYLDVGTVFKQPDAIAFHTRHGYRIEGILYDYWGSGDDLVIMSKELLSPRPLVHSPAGV
jgi:GNAT superfamily N-acetyltransferase